MKKGKIILCILFVFVFLALAGCGNSATYNKMLDDLKAYGTFSAEYNQYKIELNDDIDYYHYTDSNKISISYMDLSSSSRVMFFINFDNKTDGEYSWSLTYNDYHLYGTLTASECGLSTTSLYYDHSRSTDSASESVNSTLRKLAATCCKMCLLELEDHWIITNNTLRVSDLGFNY